MKSNIKNYIIINLKKFYLFFKIYLILPNIIFPSDLFNQFLNYKKILKKKQLYNFKNIVDIGANSGNWSILFKSLYTQSKFFLIEADKKHENKIAKISKLFHIGLVDKSKSFKRFYIYNDFNGTGSSIFKEKSNHKYKIKKMKTATLDKILKKKFSKKYYDLIKLDTQGSELNILKGATETLKKTQFIIAEIQIKNYNINSPNYKEFNSYLKKKNFKKVATLFNHVINNEISQSDVLYKNLKIKNE